MTIKIVVCQNLFWIKSLELMPPNKSVLMLGSWLVAMCSTLFTSQYYESNTDEEKTKGLRGRGNQRNIKKKHNCYGGTWYEGL